MIVTDKEKLKTVCETALDSNGLDIAAKLAIELERNESGIGLAAPQIGINKRVFVIYTETGGLVFAINPIILSKKEPYLNPKEGCLSFPGVEVSTIRYGKVTWKDQYRKKPYELIGRDALVFQHENDHLDGVLMFDRQEPGKYSPCFCGSGKKYKFCCSKLIHA